jgi:restriction endonuclease S subunit
MLKQTETQVPFMNFISSSGIFHLAEKDNAVLPDYLTLLLNSKIVRLQAERSAGGSIIQHWKQSEIENVSIPILPMSSQQKIAAKVRESFALRAESKRLLDLAKHAVELAIEQGEDNAINVVSSVAG